MKVDDIILNFINSQKLPLSTHNWAFEGPIADYAIRAYNVFHTPGTYSRAFRRMREQNIFYANGLRLTDITKKGDKTKAWLIEDMSKLPLLSQNGVPSSPLKN